MYTVFNYSSNIMHVHDYLSDLSFTLASARAIR